MFCERHEGVSMPVDASEEGRDAQTSAGRPQRSDTTSRRRAQRRSGASVTVFISYKRQDAPAHAFLLHERLRERFGTDRVFLDVATLEAGADWRGEIRRRAGGCTVLLALIGPRWLPMVRASTQRGLVEAAEDVAREEIEFALTNEAHVAVIPVLVDDAKMPAAHELPRSLRALANRQAASLRLASYDDDVEHLIERLESLSSAEPSPSEPVAHATAAGPGLAATPPHAAPDAVISKEHAAAAISTTHRRVAGLIRGAGHVVVALGSGINVGCEPLPRADDLAADLARRFSYAGESGRLRLAEVAEYVDLAWGKPDLYLTVKQDLAVDYHPNDVHTFLAAVPGTLEALGGARRHQLILTTNYDTALERAFSDACEPFDLAVYIASADRFMHVPWQREPEEVTEPNTYSGFPIGEDLELMRTVIVKIHGAVEVADTPYTGEDGYVITEDHYIDYLSGSPIDQIVPFQILQKLRSSHCLFLGYDVRDWNLRVFLKRIWGSRINAASWAIEEGAADFEEVLWRQCGVDLVSEPPIDFIRALQTCLTQADDR